MIETGIKKNYDDSNNNVLFGVWWFGSEHTILISLSEDQQDLFNYENLLMRVCLKDEVFIVKKDLTRITTIHLKLCSQSKY